MKFLSKVAAIIAMTAFATSSWAGVVKVVNEVDGNLMFSLFHTANAGGPETDGDAGSQVNDLFSDTPLAVADQGIVQATTAPFFTIRGAVLSDQGGTRYNFDFTGGLLQLLTPLGDETDGNFLGVGTFTALNGGGVVAAGDSIDFFFETSRYGAGALQPPNAVNGTVLSLWGQTTVDTDPAKTDAAFVGFDVAAFHAAPDATLFTKMMDLADGGRLGVDIRLEFTDDPDEVLPAPGMIGLLALGLLVVGSRLRRS